MRELTADTKADRVSKRYMMQSILMFDTFVNKHITLRDLSKYSPIAASMLTDQNPFLTAIRIIQIYFDESRGNFHIKMCQATVKKVPLSQQRA
jgi:hypothetical protein